MTDSALPSHEELAAALERLDDGIDYADPEAESIIAAARRQLALTPETCGTCGGSGLLIGPCDTCRGRGTAYKKETVELIERTLRWNGLDAVAVLDALNTEPA